MKRYTPIIVAVTIIILIIVALNRYLPVHVVAAIPPQDIPAPVVINRPHHSLPDLPPEYRPAPIRREYKPPRPHQVGLLKGEGDADGDLRPIYAKPSRTHRDRYHYWTTGGNGHNNYSVPVTLGGRDCTEDLGCQEMFGNEEVSVWDNPEVAYKSHVYRTDLWF